MPRRLLVLTLSLLSLPATFFGLCPRVNAADLQAGVASVDITPPLEYRMSGYFSERVATAVHDPLLAKALVLVQEDRRAAIVCCDLIGIPLDVSRRARRLAAKKTGIPVGHIVVCATHSHTGPLYFGALRKHWHDRAVARQGSDPLEAVDYPGELVEKLAGAVEQALKAARPVELSAGVGEERGLSFNRRFHMKDGSVRFNPGRLNPDIVRAAGPIDPDVGLLLVKDAQGGDALASLTVFALHLDTVGGTEYGADYPYYLQQKLRDKFGERFTSLFAAGTCGDINHIDVTRAAQPKGHDGCRAIGEQLAEAVLAALPKVKPVAAPRLAVRSSVLNLPLQKYEAERVARAARDMDKIGTRELSFLDQVETYKITALQMLEGDALPAEVQAIRLADDAAIVALPGEVFVDLGLAIKRQSPFATTLVIELANDAPGYVPTRKAFAEGSYETVNSRIQPGGGERLVEEAVRLLRDLK